MTPKQLVTEKYPDAQCWSVYNPGEAGRLKLVLLPNEDYSIADWRKHILGSGRTQSQAWQSAYERLKEEK